MAESPIERSEHLMRLMGDALVTWGEVESLWRMILPHLLFKGFQHSKEEAKREFVGRGDGEPSVGEERTFALWDSLQNSKAQVDLVLSVAPLVLTEPDQAGGLAQLLSVANETQKKRGKRNALAHGAFERRMRIERSGEPNTFVLGDEVLMAAGHAHKAIRGHDLEVVIPQIREEFRLHREAVRGVWTWLRLGTPVDAGAPSPDISQQRSRVRAPNPAERGHGVPSKKRRRRLESSQK